MAVLSAEKVTGELCREWGISSNKVAGITIELSPGSVATAIIKYYLDSNEIAILKNYELKENVIEPAS